jgi:hypothetical protein
VGRRRRVTNSLLSLLKGRGAHRGELEEEKDGDEEEEVVEGGERERESS